MKILVLLIGICMLSIFGLFVIESEVNRLSDTNKFKLWWRKNVVGEEN
jgi:hypothetical protein